MGMSIADHLIYALLWLSFGAGHSLLAGATMKRIFGPGTYRLAYNAAAMVHLAVILMAGRLWLAGDSVAFDRSVWLVVAQWGLLAIGVAVLAIALRGESLGDDNEPLRIDGLHRYIRHPLYAGMFPVLWGLADNEFSLATAVWATLYFWIGSRFEECRLVARYGDAYRVYRRRVPAFVPWKGRAA